MSKLNRIKKIVKNQVEPINIELLWANLEQHVPEKPKSRLPIFFLIASTLIVTSILSIFLYEHFASTSTMKMKEVLVDDNESQVQNNQVGDQKTKNNSEINTNPDLENSKVGEGLKPSITDTKLATANNKNKKVSQTEKYIIDNKTILIKGRPNLPKSTDKQSVTNDKIYTDNASTPIEEAPKEWLSIQAEKNESTIEQESNETNQRLTISNHSMDHLPFLRATVVQSMKGNTIGQLSVVIPNVRIKQNSRPIWISILASAGPSKIQSQKIIASNATSHSLPTIHLMLMAQRKIYSKWSLETGINFTRYTNRFTHHNTSIGNTTSRGVAYVNIDSNGNSNDIIGSVEGTKTTEVNTVWHTYHSSISTPININYEIYKSKKYSLNLGFGPQFQWINFSTGAIVNGVEGNLNKFDFSTSPFKPELLGINGRLNFNWEAGKLSGLKSFVSYDYRRLKESNNDISYTHKLSSVCIGIGYDILQIKNFH